MTIDENVEELKKEAELIARYYLSGTGNKISSIPTAAYTYIDSKVDLEEREKNKKMSFKNLKKIKDFYATIPFEELKGDENFYPLFVIDRMLLGIEEQMKRVFSEKPKQFEYDVLLRAVQTIIGIGGLYKASLTSLIKKIKSVPGNEDYKVKVTSFETDQEILFSI